MPEPIAVAFVEVRPSVDEFKVNAEQDLRSQLGPVDVQGQFRMQGLDKARAEVSALTSDLQGISTNQLQFPGLEDASRQAGLLATNLGDASQVNLAANLEPAVAQVGALAEGTDAIAQSLSGLPTNIPLASGDIGAAVEQTQALDTASSSLGGTLGTTADVASALIAKYPQLASGERNLATATDATAAAVRRAGIEEEKTSLIRAKARRAQSLGPVRLAGVGLVAGTALFAATRALGDLSEGLRVSGNEAGTFGGKMRNLGASLLSGDVVGAFKALTNDTHEFSLAELEAVHNAPQLEAALRSIGKEAELTKARLAALSQVASSPVPQFIDTAIARARATGDVGAEQQALESAEKQIQAAMAKVRTLQPEQRALQDEIRDLSERRREAVAEATRGARGGRVDIGQAVEIAGLGEQITSLKAQAGELRGPVNAALEELFNALRSNKDRQDTLAKEVADRRVSRLKQSFSDRTLAADLAGAEATRLGVLREEQRLLRKIVANEKGTTPLWRAAAAELKSVNSAIEAAAADIAAENERHRQAMIDAKLAPSEEAIVDAQLSGSGEIAALQQRAGVIQGILDKGTIDGKKLTRDERIGFKNELVSINGQIEAAQGEITAEAQRHADVVAQQAADAAKRLDEADQAFVRALGGREQRARNRQLVASASAGLADDIRVSNELQAIFRESIATARKTINDARLRADTIAGLTTALEQEMLSEKALRQQQRRDRVSRREESLDLEIQIAQTNEQRGRELRAHRAKIEFLRERIEHTRRGSLERKRLRAEIAQEQAAIRDLKDAGKDEAEQSGAAFSELAAAFLQQRRGFLTELASNIIPTGTPAFPTRTAPRPAPAPPPPSAPGPAQVSSPFGRPIRESGGQEAQAVGALALRDQGGQPPSSGQLESLIHLARNTNRLLGDIKTGVGHQQAKTSRALSKNAVEVNVGGV